MDSIFKIFKRDNDIKEEIKYTYSWKRVIEAIKIAINYEKNPILLSFFSDYDKAIHEINNIDAKEEILLMKEYEDTLREELKKILDMEASLKALGVNVSRTTGFSKKISVYVDPTVDDKVSIYSSPFYLFNDIELGIKDLENGKLINYEKKLEKLMELYHEYDIVYLKNRLEKLINYENIFPFINNMYASEIEDINKKLEMVKKLEAEMKEIEKKIKTFNNFTSTEKEKIKELLLCIKKFGKRKNGYDNEKSFDNISMIYGYNMKKMNGRRKVYSRALKYMLNNGEFTLNRKNLIINEIKNVSLKIADYGYPNNLFTSEIEKKKCLNIYPEYNRLVIELLKFLYPDEDFSNGNAVFIREEGLKKN